VSAPLPGVSCTILAYNEEATLEEATADVVRELRGLGREAEVLIVDDGSTDRTPEIAAEMARRYPEVRVLSHGENRGPGSAILTGFRASRREVVCFHPADQQVSFAEVAALVPLLDDHDLVVVSRSARPGYTALRLLSSHVYIALVHLLFGLREFDDFNFLHLYRKSLLDRIEIETEGVFVPTEILVKARALGARIARASAACLPRRAGVATCGKPSVIARTFAEMVRFFAIDRWRALLGLSGEKRARPRRIT
jgi:glycosyltransferase involved in cell wall biosynthesis